MSNLSVLSGNLTRDPDIRYLKDGTPTCSFGIAVDRRWQDRESGEWNDATSFFDVACWRDLAENVTLNIEKGARVIVVGRFEQRTWTGEDGKLRHRVELVAEDVGSSWRFAAHARGANSSDEDF